MTIGIYVTLFFDGIKKMKAMFCMGCSLIKQSNAKPSFLIFKEWLSIFKLGVYD